MISGELDLQYDPKPGTWSLVILDAHYQLHIFRHSVDLDIKDPDLLNPPAELMAIMMKAKTFVDHVRRQCGDIIAAFSGPRLAVAVPGYGLAAPLEMIAPD